MTCINFAKHKTTPVDEDKFYEGYRRMFNSTDDVEEFILRMRPFFQYHPYEDENDIEDMLYENFCEAKANAF